MLTSRREMSKVEKFTEDRALAQRMLDGTMLVPTKTCRCCGGRVLVKDGQIEMVGEGLSGSALVPEITLCLDGCKKTTVRRVSGLGNFKWRYGAAEVDIADGPSFVATSLPQLVTAKQSLRLQDFLAQTAA